MHRRRRHSRALLIARRFFPLPRFLPGFPGPRVFVRMFFCHSGGHSRGVPPLPIPNRAVKPARADGTASQWESRSPPFSRPPAPRKAGGLLFSPERRRGDWISPAPFPATSRTPIPPLPVEEAGFHSFNVIAATFYEHYDEILNFYNNRSSNAMAESFNAKIKLFRANLRGVADKKFFLFRIANLYAFPPLNFD